MIPRHRPPFSARDLMGAALSRRTDAVAQFERAFARRFGFEHAVFFPYARSALYALLRAFGWDDGEVILPAYTCAVVAHAVASAGLRPVFVDSQPDHFNVGADALSAALGPRTRGVVATPLYGYPIDGRGYARVLQAHAPAAPLIYDAAHAFGVADADGPQLGRAHCAFFSFGMGKVLSTVVGGMLLVRDHALLREVQAVRDAEFRPGSRSQSAATLFRGLATWAALHQPALTLTDLLERRTRLLQGLVDAGDMPDTPRLSDACLVRPSPVQAALGLRQLTKYDALIASRRAAGERYEQRLRDEGFPVFAWIGQPTYARFPLRVADRAAAVALLRAQGVQVGIFLRHICPELAPYREEAAPERFPHALQFARTVLTLPNWAGITMRQVEHVVTALCRCRDRHPMAFGYSTDTPASGPVAR